MNLSCWRSGLLSTLLCLLFLTFSPQSLAGTSQNRALQSTVRIICKTDQYSTGSGFVVGESDYVVTNWHVVDCSDKHGEVSVYLQDGSSFKASVVSAQPHKDLAILKLFSPLKQPPVKFATGATVAVGDDVWVAGFPGSADGIASSYELGVVSLSKGIISRLIQSREGVALYQTEAAINPGNSGGPMLDEFGRVIGINAAKDLTWVATVDPGSKTGSPVGLKRLSASEIGWAIQVDELLPELDKLHISYDVDTSQPNFLMRLWYRDPFMLVIFSAVLLLSYVLIRLLYQQKKPVTSGSLKPALAQHNRPPFATGLARLYCLTGPYAGNNLELDNKPLTIGRDPELCQLVMPSTLGSIGRRHCSITFNKNTQCFWLEDHGSTNGTFLKAQRLTPGKSQRLESGDHFYLDSLENEFKVGLGE